MISNRSLLEHVLVAYREGDLDECVRLVRTLVEAAPLATAPRQLLASLFAQTGRGRLAVGHYRKLLATAVARGDVIRAIAFQKQIDEFQIPEVRVPDRWSALQAQLRSHGLSFLIVPPGANGRPWTEEQLLALPPPWFERIAAETRFEFFGIEPRTMEVEAGTVWEMLAGRMRWSFALPDGRASVEAIAAEGDAVHIDPKLARRARLAFLPELPVETLRFDAALARDLRTTLAGARSTPDETTQGAEPETRAQPPTSSRPPQDLDDAPPSPLPPAATMPPCLEARADGSPPTTSRRDSGDWLEFGIVSLGEGSTEPAGEAGEPREAVGSPCSWGPEAAIPATETATPATGAPATATPRIEAPGTATPDDRDPVRTPAAPRDNDPALAAPATQAGAPSERRRHPRVAVSYESRVALLRLTESRMATIRGQLTDLSTSGLRIRFAKQELVRVRGALADAVVAVDLDLPGTAGAMRVAAQVRWLEVDARADEARLGIEFVLLTEPDRRRIAGTLARAALASGFGGRTAA